MALGATRQQQLFSDGGDKLRVAGLFAGIGGIERGLHQAGHTTEFLCEYDESAATVLRAKFDAEPVGDVRDVNPRRLPPVDLLAGGFPCQDLSQAGRTTGIKGEKSGLVKYMFEIMEGMRPRPTWVLVENVPFMLQLEKGKAMAYLTRALGEAGYRWAYRVVDTRAFGLPQRRQRVILLASKTEDPRCVLFADEAGPEPDFEAPGVAYGFYWTEGIRGLGWAPNGVPTLKGGSTVGIPSPPAIWMPDGSFVKPEIRDAERLQGFPADWTLCSMKGITRKNGPRWKLVGNAVSVPVARWVGQRLAKPGRPLAQEQPLQAGARWPVAAWGERSQAYKVDLSRWPKRYKYKDLLTFLKYPPEPLSLRAASGFRGRTKRASLRFRPEFLEALDAYIAGLTAAAVA